MQEAKNGNKMQRQFSSLLNEHWKRKQRLKKVANTCSSHYTRSLYYASHYSSSLPFRFLIILALLICNNNIPIRSKGQSILQSDPRPTIYSGQVSFGLLLSAHSSLGTELSSSASQQVVSRLLLSPYADSLVTGNLSTTLLSTEETRTTNQLQVRSLERRQIFDRPRGNRYSSGASSSSTTSSPSGNRQHQQVVEASGPCSQVNANALYAGMGAIWASHQANLVGDSQIAIGTYVYDSCNDLDVGQRQSVRIVSNINAFQQTTCEAPRGSPISLTIAHGDNQLRAIQLLTSFRVPVITTREHFALEEYQALSPEQRRFLFSTAHSSRHLAKGALRFSKQLVARTSGSPKLHNQFYRMSSRNALVVISRNLPERFLSYLADSIPNQVNYEILQSSQPIEQIQSLEAVESILLANRRNREMESREESRVHSKVAPQAQANRRSTTTTTSGDTSLNDREADNDSSSPDYSASSESENESSLDSDLPSTSPGDMKMLSPTILMFITPAEAIDLITRLRNDLAEVSRYYSLIVITREDISPALKTIFQRGGSRLCSGKPFFTVSPRPDEIGEFSRYFRDTVQLEGDSSDHPLVCEFARYQASSRVSADLDDVSTEPVIKAVWAAAAAFKSVHKRECSGSSTFVAGNSVGASSNQVSTGISPVSQPGDNGITTSQQGSVADTQQQKPGASKLGTGSGSAHYSGRPGNSQSSECMNKLGKNMSGLVQRALKRLNVTINSTGLQSLDGFPIRFDDAQELMTNRFSIRYVSKECEITEIGTFSGQMDARLRMDEVSLAKALEGSLPEPWPAPPPTPPRTTPAPSSSAPPTRSSAKQVTAQSINHQSDSDYGELPATQTRPATPSPTTRSRRKQTVTPVTSSETPESPVREMSSLEPDEQPRPTTTSTRSKLRKRTRDFARQKQRAAAGTPAPPARATLMSRGDIRDEEWPTALDTTESIPSATASSALKTTGELRSISVKPPTIRPGRTLKPFPTLSPTVAAKLEGLVPASASGLLGVLKGDGSDGSSLVELEASGSSRRKQPESAADDELDHASVWPGKKRMREQHHSGTSAAQHVAPTTTQVPSGVHSTLPESDGNADLEIPAHTRSSSSSSSKSLSDSSNLSTAASSTQSVQDYVTAAPSVIQSHTLYPRIPFNQSLPGYPALDEFSLSSPSSLNDKPPEQARRASTGDYMTSVSSSSDLSNAQRTRLRSHIKWIYSSWYALSILGANICGALLTLYVLTFLLMKNCDGSLERENQGLRSIHLLAIIVVFFGSTLFIVHPTPALCLLRNSWHNFALVLLFGSLLLQAMQTSSMSTIGLGGRPHRLNQFLTLLFMVGVQVSFELQRWRYESSSYLSFVSQHLGGSPSSSSVSADQHKKLLMLSRATSEQLNPLSSFTDYLTPVSIQVSEHYQSLLQDYCIQQAADDFMQGQVYLVIVVLLLVAFSLANRRNAQLNGLVASKSHQRLASGKLVASQHEANLVDHLSSSHFQLNPMGGSPGGGSGVAVRTKNLFAVSLTGACVYFVSLALHTYGQSFVNRDLVSSVTMVVIAFLALLGIFLPILIQLQRSFGSGSGSSSSSTRNLPVTRSSDGTGSDLTLNGAIHSALSPGSGRATFAMFPEFAPTGLRRPSSEAGATTSAGSSSGASGSRRLFAETKESRRNMGAALAHLGPSEDSLRSMGFYESREIVGTGTVDQQQQHLRNSVIVQERLDGKSINSSAINDHQQQQHRKPSSQLPVKTDAKLNNNHHHHHHHHRNSSEQVMARNQQPRNQHQTKRSSSGEKRLIMLDVDPCCPRHGVSAWTAN